MFEAHHKWLGIPKELQPPTHYQLLGISPGEEDPEVIEEAAIRQTAHVRTYQTGPHVQECTRLLNEIAQARTTLLDPAKRKAYDARLLPQTAAPAVPIACPVPPVNSALPAGDVAAGEVFANLAGPPSAAGSAAAMRPPPDEPGHRALWFWVAGGVLLTAVVIAGIAVFLFGNKPDALKGKPGDADPGRVETK